MTEHDEDLCHHHHPDIGCACVCERCYSPEWGCICPDCCGAPRETDEQERMTMAKAEKHEEVVTTTTYTLTLTQKEAEALLLVASRIGGPYEGPRGRFADIVVALEEAGAEYEGFNYEYLDDDHGLVQNRSAIYFKEEAR